MSKDNKNENKKNNKNNVFTFDMYPWKYIPNWPRNIRQFFRNIRYAYQRAVKGYCDSDIYSIRDWFLETVPYMIKQMSENLSTYPAMDSDNYYQLVEKLNHKVDLSNFKEGETDEEFEKWRSILEEMSRHFMNANTEYYNSSEEAYAEFKILFSKDEGDAEKLFDNINKDNENPEYRKRLHEYFEKEKQYFYYTTEEFEKGINMFQKCFWDLWD